MPQHQQEVLMPAPDVPHIPDPAGLPSDAEGNILGGDAKWTKYGGRHVPCEWCVLAIHQKLHNRHPQPARLRRKGPNGDALLCHQHGERQQTRDAVVARRLEQIRSSQKKTRGR